MEEERTKKPHVTITFAGATEDVEVFYVLVLKTWSEYASHLQRKFANLKGVQNTMESATNLILGGIRERDRKNSFLPLPFRPHRTQLSISREESCTLSVRTTFGN